MWMKGRNEREGFAAPIRFRDKVRWGQRTACALGRNELDLVGAIEDSNAHALRKAKKFGWIRRSGS